MSRRLVPLIFVLSVAILGAYLGSRSAERTETHDSPAAGMPATPMSDSSAELASPESMTVARLGTASGVPEAVSPTAERDSDMAPWGPWRKMRLEEIDRSLRDVLEDRDPSTRVLTAQMFIIAAVSPLADERGLSERASTAAMKHRAQPDEHVFQSNRNYYRIPKGTYPLLDEFMEYWREHSRLISDMTPEQMTLLEAEQPALADRFGRERLERLAEEARAALQRRKEPY